MELTLTLIIFLFPLAYSPGPGNLFFAASSARFGFSKTISANIGYHVATWIVTLAIGLGFGWIINEFLPFLTIIKYAGGVYVLYLAWSLLRSGIIENGIEARNIQFIDGVLLLILNPKAYIIIALMFSQFLPNNKLENLWVIILITTVFTLNNLLAFSLWAYAGDRLAAVFRNEEYARYLNIFFGSTLAAVGIWMLLV